MGEIHDTTEARLRWLEELSEKALHHGSESAVTRQRERGKLLARERVEKLLDPGSFVELDRFVRHREVEFDMRETRPWGDAVFTGDGTVFGRKVFVLTKRKQLSELKIEPSASWGWALFGTGIAIHTLSALWKVYFSSGFSLLLVLPGLVLLCLGKQHLKNWLLPSFSWHL